MKVTVEGFAEGANIPARFTCDGANARPAVSWTGEPSGTMSYALIVDDPDAPGGTWNHWLVWDIPADKRELPEGGMRPDGTQGTNDFGKIGYGGPCPPRGGGPHRYYFRLFAINAHTLGLREGANRAALDKAVKDHVIGQAEYMGRYGRE